MIYSTKSCAHMVDFITEQLFTMFCNVFFLTNTSYSTISYETRYVRLFSSVFCICIRGDIHVLLWMTALKHYIHSYVWNIHVSLFTSIIKYIKCSTVCWLHCLIGIWCFHFHQYLNYIVVVSGLGRRNRSTRRKPLTCHKSLTNFIT